MRSTVRRWPTLARATGAVYRASLQAGPAGWLALAVLLAAALLGGGGHLWLDAERTALQQQRAQLQRDALQPPAGSAPRERLEAYYAERFPPAAAMSERLSQIYALARREGIVIKRADYRSVAERGTPLQRVALVLPVQGEFARIYRWLDAVLVEMPEVGLESISIRRTGSEASQVEAELRLMMFLRDGA